MPAQKSVVKVTSMNNIENKPGCKKESTQTYVEILQHLTAAKYRYSPRLLLNQHFSFSLEGALPYLVTNVNPLPED